MVADPINKIWIRPITTRLAKYVNVNPNLITFAALLVGSYSLYSLYMLDFVRAGILFLIYEMLDDLDGDVARTWKRSSKNGKFFDNFVDTLLIPLFPLILGYSLGYTFIGFLCYIGYVLNDYTYYSGNDDQKPAVNTQSNNTAKTIIISVFTMGTGFQILLLSLGVIFAPLYSIYIYAFGINVNWAVRFSRKMIYK
ncbi:MAG: hypothetical protein GQ477_03010 [Nanohaloarchaea archaeon]|nr:hypothetical protein [Candidatus Nanohaloarchaea archaeon]